MCCSLLVPGENCVGSSVCLTELHLHQKQVSKHCYTHFTDGEIRTLSEYLTKTQNTVCSQLDSHHLPHTSQTMNMLINLSWTQFSHLQKGEYLPHNAIMRDSIGKSQPAYVKFLLKYYVYILDYEERGEEYTIYKYIKL